MTEPVHQPHYRTIWVLCAAVAVLAAAALWWADAWQIPVGAGGSVAGAGGRAVPSGNSSGRLDVTFLVGADTHFGATARLPAETQLNPTFSAVDAQLNEVNHAVIQQMNRTAGRPYPKDIGGAVDPPRALLLAGDLTEDGTHGEWEAFEAAYGHNGRDGRLRMPLYAVIGNHDKNRGDLVARSLHARHGGAHYTWQWDGLHFVALGEGPDDWGIQFLRKTLAQVGRDAPIILWFHYPLLGPFSRGQWFGDGDYRDKLLSSIDDYRIIAIFHGHYHGSGHYRWHGFDVYNVGSPKHSARSYAVVHVTRTRLVVCSWNTEGAYWWWWHSKSIDPLDTSPDEILGTDRGPNRRFRPSIPYPISH